MPDSFWDDHDAASSEGPTVAPAVSPSRQLQPVPPAARTVVEDRPALPATQAMAEVEPAVFAGYELLGEIARGGMGVVYRARQVRLNRLVALKTILPATTNGSDTVRRFRAEAEAVARLDHPNIVPIYEVGEHEGQPFFSMKLVEGSSLDRELKHFRSPPRAAVRLLATVARAVHHAHARGILHRDLKPANILLQKKETTNHTNHTNKSKKKEDHDRHADQFPSYSCDSCDSWLNASPVVTDFGLAKQFGSDGQVAQSEMIVGTASYMAPEQAMTDKPTLTTASDVYSLGAILYELLILLR
jgi:serine/threonine-protein kinase